MCQTQTKSYEREAFEASKKRSVRWEHSTNHRRKSNDPLHSQRECFSACLKMGALVKQYMEPTFDDAQH